MWHEVRKQERKIRCLIVDYKRRAERRKDYYQRIKADPTQFLQVHGRPCKVHLDPAIVAAGDSSVVMMNWAASPDVLIDRFDVRAHLDCVPEPKNSDLEDDQLNYDERYVNYERYRILVQNDFVGVSEEKFLNQLHLEEQFGASTRTGFVAPPIEGKKKVAGAAIGYNYDDAPSCSGSGGGSVADIALPAIPPCAEEGEPHPSAQASNDTDNDPDDDEDDDDSDLDFDVCVDVNQVTTAQAHELNNCSHCYGMEGNDFFSFLTKDKEEADNLRIAKEIEEEKSMFSGRKSRRERRLYREKQLAGRKISPPSYASRRSPTYNDYKDQLRSTTLSRSPSPDNSGRITYITSFGDEEQVPTEACKPSVGPPAIIDKLASGSVRKSPSGSNYSQNRGRNHHDSSSRSPNRYNDRLWSPNHSHRSPERRNRRNSRSPGRFRRHSPPRRYSRSPNRNRRRSRSLGRRSRYCSRDNYSPGDKHSSRDRYSPRDRYNSSRDSHLSSRDKYASRDKYSPVRNRPLYSRRTPSPSPAQVYSPKVRSNTNNKPTPGSSKNETVPSQSSQQSTALPRYYGRRREKSSSSELSFSESEDTSNSMTNSEKLGSSDIGNASGRTKPAVPCGSANMAMRDRLKRKMQIMLHRQFKADKKAEKEKQERVEQERIDREDEMREMSIKLRKRERQKRHEYYAELERLERRSRSRSRSQSRSRRSSSSSSSSSNRSRYRRRRRRSKSRSSSLPHSRISSRSSSGDRKKKSPKGLVDY